MWKSMSVWTVSRSDNDWTTTMMCFANTLHTHSKAHTNTKKALHTHTHAGWIFLQAVGTPQSVAAATAVWAAAAAATAAAAALNSTHEVTFWFLCMHKHSHTLTNSLTDWCSDVQKCLAVMALLIMVMAFLNWWKRRREREKRGKRYRSQITLPPFGSKRCFLGTKNGMWLGNA